MYYAYYTPQEQRSATLRGNVTDISQIAQGGEQP
jgi:hypothetical protein